MEMDQNGERERGREGEGKETFGPRLLLTPESHETKREREKPVDD